MQNNIFLNLRDCKKLVLAGFKPETIFYYNKKDNQIYHVRDIFTGVTDFDKIYTPAFTDADLIKLLPGKITIRNKHNVTAAYDLVIYKSARSEEKYFIEYRNTGIDQPSLAQQCASSEVQSKANMILHLISKGHLK